MTDISQKIEDVSDQKELNFLKIITGLIFIGVLINPGREAYNNIVHERLYNKGKECATLIYGDKQSRFTFAEKRMWDRDTNAQYLPNGNKWPTMESLTQWMGDNCPDKYN